MKYILFFGLLIGCKHSNHRTVTFRSIIAKGDIVQKNIYNGKIEFFDSSTMKKISEENYLNGILNGPSRKFNDNGKLSYECDYVFGKINGFAKSYDSSGILDNVNFFYYDIPMGPILHYKKLNLASYSFYAFDGKLLFTIDYDSIRRRKITDFEHDFFFFTLRDIKFYDSTSFVPESKVHIFLYKPSPPKYSFKYNLVEVNNKYEVGRVIHDFADSSCWETTDFKASTTNSAYHYALRLIIEDSLDMGKHTMFKNL